MIRTKGHGCAYGLKSEGEFVLKTGWWWLVSSEFLASAVSRLCPGHERHNHLIGSSRTRPSGKYPVKLLDAIVHGFLQVDSVKDVVYSSFSGESDDVEVLVMEAGDSKRSIVRLRLQLVLEEKATEEKVSNRKLTIARAARATTNRMQRRRMVARRTISGSIETHRSLTLSKNIKRG